MVITVLRKCRLSIKLGAQLQRKQWSGATLTLNRLIALEPARWANWWQQLANIQIRAGAERRLSTLKLAKYQRCGVNTART